MPTKRFLTPFAIMSLTLGLLMSGCSANTPIDAGKASVVATSLGAPGVWTWGDEYPIDEFSTDAADQKKQATNTLRPIFDTLKAKCGQDLSWAVDSLTVAAHWFEYKGNRGDFWFLAFDRLIAERMSLNADTLQCMLRVYDDLREDLRLLGSDDYWLDWWWYRPHDQADAATSEPHIFSDGVVGITFSQTIGSTSWSGNSCFYKNVALVNVFYGEPPGENPCQELKRLVDQAA